jgi:histidinol dehydrogenase
MYMIRRIDLRESVHAGRPVSNSFVDVVPRAATNVADATKTITPILEDIRTHGAQAVARWSLTLDGVTPPSLRVPTVELENAAENLDPAVRAALLESIRRARIVHSDQVRGETLTQVVEGGTVTERWIPVDRVGLYVPGGQAVYPSSVVMNVVPAQIAGVGSIAVVSPPQKDWGGWPHPVVMAACHLLGIDEVYSVGGAQAVAMLAYGVDLPEGDCRPVDLVTGPGNIYVTAAKRALQGIIGIDSEAGPTEILILADDTADPVHIAADLISQAEHDELAAAVLVTDSCELADLVEASLAVQVPLAKHSERIETALRGVQSAIILVNNLEQGLAVVDDYAAEHLEIHVANAPHVARRVKHAGAIFVGTYAPVSLGDYCAGSNHVLPTAGSAKHSSGLSVQTFLRGIHIIEYSQQALAEVAPHVLALSSAEDLPAHGQAILVRLQP